MINKKHGDVFKYDNINGVSNIYCVYIEHISFTERLEIGIIAVNIRIVDKIINIFEELKNNNYQIEKIILIDEYGFDDEKSMMDNNTSAYNYRNIIGTKKLSNHARGLAVDINPLYNPYIKKINNKLCVFPKNSSKYINRDINCKYFIGKNDICYNIFKKHGFSWGGDWASAIDYQHFEYNI